MQYSRLADAVMSCLQADTTAAGRDVQLAGDFNAWTPDNGVITRHADGVVEKIVMLMPGTYQYRYVVGRCMAGGSRQP